MATDRRRKTDQVVTPFTDPAFRRSSVYFDDIEYQRHFEQNLIRYNLLNGVQVDGKIQNITNLINAGGGGGGQTQADCYWTKEGSDLLYEEGSVGVKCHPTLGDFEVRGNLVVEAKGGEDPYIDIVNWSDTEKDPMLRFAAGATIVRKFTIGMDDSDADSWLLCSGDILTSTVTGEVVDLAKVYDGTMVVVDSGNGRIKRHFTSNDMAYISKIGSVGSGDNNFNGARGVCSDGIYTYVCDCDNYRIVKRKIVDLSYVSQVGSFGTGNTQFKNPVGVCTDGVHIYVADKINNRVTKLVASDLSFSAKTLGTEGFNNPAAICTDGINLYIIQNPGETWRMIKLACSNLALVARRLKDGHDNSITPQGIAYNLGYCWIVQTNNSYAPVMKYRSSDLAYDSEWGVFGSSDGQVTGPYAIATNGSNIFVSDVGVGFANPQRIQKFTMAGVYVAKYGTYGTGDTNFYQVYGICMVGYISGTTTTPLRAPIIKASINGDWVDAYPVLRVRDGLQLMEDGTVAATKYVQLLAPSSITASYDIIFPAAVPTAQGHLSISTGGQISWGQDVRSSASPTFVRLTLSQAIGTAPMTITSTTKVNNLNADMLDGSHDTAFVKLTAVLGDVIYGDVTPAWAKLTGNITTTKKYLSQTGTGTISAAPTWAQIDHGADLAGLADDDHTQYLLASGARALTANWDAGSYEIRAQTFQSDMVTGTAPFTIASTTVVANLNADLVDGQHAAAFAPASHAILSASHSDTIAATVLDGDILIGQGLLPGWPYRKLINLPVPASSQTSFPVCIKINADADIGAHARSDGHDIRFITTDGVPLPYERDEWSVAGGAATAIFWVKTDVAALGTSIYLYYGNAAAADGEDAEAVWDANFKAVYHMKDATTSTTLDSTANNNDGTKKGANEPIEAAGKIGKGQDFDGTDDAIAVAGLNWTPAEFSISFWIYERAIGNYYPRLSAGSGWGSFVFHGEVGTGVYVGTDIPNRFSPVELPAGTLVQNAWAHFVYSHDGTSGRFYKNGNLLAGPKAQDASLQWGGGFTMGGTAGDQIDGLVDEVHISSIARSAEWIAYEYANMNPADGGLTWGAEEDSPAKWIRLGKGTEGQVLTIVSGIPAWA